MDAEEAILGRMASQVALRLRGKHKPTLSPHMESRTHVIVVNAEKVVLTGKKTDEKLYHYHTGHPGGIKTATARSILEGRHPERVVEKAVQRMLGNGPLAREQLRRMRVYAGPEHPHTAQRPQALDFWLWNRKNVTAERFRVMSETVTQAIKNAVTEITKTLDTQITPVRESLSALTNAVRENADTTNFLKKNVTDHQELTNDKLDVLDKRLAENQRETNERLEQTNQRLADVVTTLEAIRSILASSGPSPS